MIRAAYGELHDHQFIKQVGDYELWIAKVQYPNRSIQWGYNLRMSGSMSNNAPFHSEDEAIAKGAEQAEKLTAENQVRFDVLISEQENRTPAESLRQSLQEAKQGKRLPLEQMWDGIEEGGDNA